MTTVPGTYFTEEQLEADLKADKVLDGACSDSNKLNHYGFVYHTEWKQYDKALAWYILAARENNSKAQNNIGVLYRDGLVVPKNYLCALKWYLKAAEGNDIDNTSNHIGWLFEYGYGVSLDKYKALEWYCRYELSRHKERLKKQGYHRSKTDKKKPFEQLRKETEAILEAEKKKLEEKQNKSQQEMKALVDLNITYKLTGGGQNAWKDVPILFIDDKKRYTNPINSSVTCSMNEILELEKQIQLLKQEESNFQLQIRERDRQITLLTGDFLHQKNTSNRKIVSLKSENQELKYKIHEYEQQMHAKDSKINLLENKHHTSSVQQTQTLDVLVQEKQTIEQNKRSTVNEMERLKASYTTLEQLLKAKEDTIVLLNRENKMLSMLNQENQQGANEMVDTLKDLLQGKNNEIELLKQNIERLLANEQQRNDAFEKENKMKQEMPQQQATVQNTGPSNTTPTNSDPSHHDQHDDSYNNINYKTEESDGDDINYDTPSEDEDSNDDLNYDNTNESNK